MKRKKLRKGGDRLKWKAGKLPGCVSLTVETSSKGKLANVRNVLKVEGP